MYLVGKIISTHGIKGELVIVNKSDFNRFFVGAKMCVIIEDQEVNLTITSLREHKGNFLVTFNKIYDINSVLFLKGKELYSREKAETQEDEYYYDDLIDKKVCTPDNVVLGKVLSIIDTGSQELLEVQLTSGQIKLVPFVDEFVKEIKKTKIIITPIEGLL
jgi:16S rRNA processing protein RimM